MATLDSIFTSHMVFPAGKPIRIYGNGKGEIQISFAGQTKTVQSDGDRWEIEFPPMEYGGPYTLTVRIDGEELLLEDIFVGEVFLMSGQSNMQFKLRNSDYPPEQICGNDKVRLFVAPCVVEGEPYTPKDGWMVCTEDNAPNWSALAYHVGQFFAKKGIAVGLIGCYQGASIIETWLPDGTLDALGITLVPEEKCTDFTYKGFALWNHGEGVLYRESLSKIFPFPLSAVVWYQGESNWNAIESRYYKKELSALVRSWRTAFREEDLPFAIVQIADYTPRLSEGWSNIQRAQYEIQFDFSGVKTVFSKDISQTDNIHPPTKVHLAERIAETLCQLIKK